MSARFDVRILSRLRPAMRRGDAHEILGLDPSIDLRAALAVPPPWDTDAYGKLLALTIAADHFAHAALHAVIHDFAEHTYFGHDDEGYALAQLNADLGALHASDTLGLFDEQRAHDYWAAALGGPDADGVLEALAALLAGSARPLARLRALHKRHTDVLFLQA